MSIPAFNVELLGATQDDTDLEPNFGPLAE